MGAFIDYFGGGGSSKGLYAWKMLTAEGGDFVDFVISNDENKYPNGAVHTDGYYYEMVVNGIDLSAFGFTKFAVDEYIPTYDQKYATIAGTAEGHKFNHSLGEVPKFAIIWCPNLMVSDYYGSRYYLASAEIGVSDPSAGDSNSKGFSIYSYTYSDANYLREGQSTNSALGACFKSDYVWTRYYSTFPYLKGGETYYIITFA